MVWIALVLPLTSLGFGSEADAWRAGKASEEIWQSGEYVRSRSTGFPLFELGITPFVELGGWQLSNIAVMMFGLGLISILFLLSDINKLTNPVITICTLAFLPIITVNSSSTIDYIVALALLLFSYYLMLKGKYLLTAVLVGVACGFRPSSGLFMIPLCIYTYLETKSLSLVTKMFLIALVLGVMAYSPALIKYGIPHSLVFVRLDLATRFLIGGYNILKLFGIIQTIVLVCVLAYFLRREVREHSFTPFVIFHMVVVLLWTALFFFLPYKPGYLLPLVPSIILLTDKLVPKRVLIILMVVLLSYHVVQLDVLGGESGSRDFNVSIRPGLTVEDIQDRLFKLSTRAAATDYYTTQRTVLMYGEPWIPVLNDKWVYDPVFCMYRQREGLLYVSCRIREETRVQELKAQGFRLVVWTEEKWEYVRTANWPWQDNVELVYDLEDFFGVPLVGKAINQR